MLISHEWLQDFVKIKKASPEDIAARLTMSTVEVEGVHTLGDGLDHIVVGVVEKVEKHPNADKLQVCHVAIGKGKAQAVCGGSNVREGMKVAFGKVGAQVRWHGQGDLITLEKATIRGVESSGMICAADEIGLGEQFPKNDEKEILDFSHLNSKPGTPLAKALSLGGVVLDIENKSLSNRPDLWGHYGIAREVAALYNVQLQEYRTIPIKAGADTLPITVSDDRCRRYTAVVVDGIEMTSSPDWMQQRLIATGVRPINLVVDITNYVMLELGQPMHAFDAMKLKGGIRIRAAKKGESITTLGNKERTLDGDLIIADSKTPIAVAGVIGGANSDIDENTTTIVFESANFEGVSVRRTAAKLGIRTDSSTRFEKQLDPTMCVTALERAVALLLEHCPSAKVASAVADEGKTALNQGPIAISEALVAKKVGISIPKKEIVEILTRLGFVVKETKAALQVTVPTWRATGDIGIVEDLIEEIIRLYGYDNISASFPVFSITPPPQRPVRRITRTIKEALAYKSGFSEVYNYSFESPEWLAKIGIDSKKHIELENPVAKDRPLVRRSLVPNLLANVSYNAHRFDHIALFEVGKTYLLEEDGALAEPTKKERLPKQDTMLGLVFAEKGNEQPFFHLSGALTSAMLQIGAALTHKKRTPKETYAHPGRYADVLVGDTKIGFVTSIHPLVQERLGIPFRTAVASLNVTELVPLLSAATAYQAISQYPGVQRDVAMIVDRDIEHADVVGALEGADDLLVSTILFDVYDGKKMAEGKKSMAYRCTYRSSERTLETKEVEDAHAKIIEILKKKFHAEIRQ